MLTVLVWSITIDPGGPTSSPAAGDSSGVITELRALRASVRKLGRAPVAQGPAALPSVNEADSSGVRTPDLEPLLESLGRTLERLDQSLGGNQRGPAGLTQARELRRESDWNALLPIAQAMSRDSEQAKKGLRFLTPTELLERFGPPEEVYAAKGSAAISWYYRRAGIIDGEDAVVSEVTFRIQDDYVIDAWGEDHETELILDALEGKD
jgi:hypothetical protein